MRAVKFPVSLESVSESEGAKDDIRVMVKVMVRVRGEGKGMDMGMGKDKGKGKGKGYMWANFSEICPLQGLALKGNMSYAY